MRKRTITAVAGASAVAVGLSVAGSAIAMASPSATGKPVTITVTMSDFKFKLSKPSVPKGTAVVFNVINKGPSPHDFDVEGTKGTPVIVDGQEDDVEVHLRQGGQLPLHLHRSASCLVRHGRQLHRQVAGRSS